MNRDTYDAIQELAVQRGIPGHSLDEKEVMQAYNYLAANGKAQLEAPKIAGPQLARAIMQEAVVDYAGQAITATDMGKDFPSANLLRQAIDADKLTAAIAIGRAAGREGVCKSVLRSVVDVTIKKKKARQ